MEILNESIKLCFKFIKGPNKSSFNKNKLVHKLTGSKSIRDIKT